MPKTNKIAPTVDVSPLIGHISEAIAIQPELFEPIVKYVAFATTAYLHDKAKRKPEVKAFLKPYLVALTPDPGQGGGDDNKDSKIDDPVILG